MVSEAFLERMKNLLGDDYAEFESALAEAPVRGVRANRIYLAPDELVALGTLPLTPLEYTDEGFALDSDIVIGKTPEHHSGMIYIQDPGAMSTLSAVDIPRGGFVLDTCAAPGGKASKLAEAVGKKGFLVANEYVPKRAKIMVGNLERLGIGNAMVTSMDTAELARYFDAAFDLVLCDAPCSGEGMFRKSQNALDDWSEENVRACARRQGEILDNIAGLVAGGGYLLYSTCTYSLEENEMTVDAFLERHPEYSLVPVKESLAKVTADGITFEGARSSDLNMCRRFYPHVSRGEGQFIALMQRGNVSAKKQTIVYKDAAKPLSKEEKAAIDEFISKSLTEKPDARVIKHGENIVIIQHGCPLLPKSVFMYGTLMGEVQKGIFKPSHHFFSVYGRDFKEKIELEAGDVRLERYLSGEEIDIDGTVSGWCAVTYRGVPLGGGKASGGRLKNHYPKGLRN